MRRKTSSARRRRARGFTLLELIIVVAMIGILATLAIPALRDSPTRAQEAVLKSNLHTLRDVIDQHYGDKGHYPTSLDALVEEGYFRDVPMDPILKANDQWELVYEELDPEAELAETDVPEDNQPGIVDVRSGSDRFSLDGETRYNEW